MPKAHTDGDSIVHFRGTDVIALGDLMATESYPVIDVERGGSINGIIDGLNRVLDLAIAEFRLEGGTMMVPGHGRIVDSGDVAYYRDMVTIIRDRVQDMVKKEMTLDQVKAAQPTADYDTEYGTTPGRGRPTCSSRRSTRALAEARTPPRRRTRGGSDERRAPVGDLRRLAGSGSWTRRVSCDRAVALRQRLASAQQARRRRRRHARPRRSISPATGSRSSPTTGAGGWSRRRRATCCICR